MIYTKIHSKFRTIMNKEMVLYGTAAGYVLLHLLITQQVLYWTYPNRSDSFRQGSIALVCLILTVLLTKDLGKTITYIVCDRVPLSEANSRMSRACWHYVFLSIMLAVGNVVGLVMGFSPEFLWIGGAGVLALLWILPGNRQDDNSPQILRGRKLLSMSKARNQLKAQTQPNEPCVLWAGLALPERFTSEHFVIVGTTKSGKTITMRLLMQSVLSDIQPGSGWNSLIYDPKGDMLQIIEGIAPTCPVHMFLISDNRSVALDIAQDANNPFFTLQVAANFIQMEKGSSDNTFFIHAARGLMAAVMDAFNIIRPGQWTLADVLLTLSDQRKAEDLLRSAPETVHKADQYFGDMDPRTIANVMFTITAHMAMMEPIAAAWSRAEKKISLRAWLKEESILLLGTDESLRKPIDALNRTIFELATQLLLSQSESETRRCWCFIDELKEAGRWESLPRLLNEGRSKGVRVCMGFQQVEGLRDVYGEHLAAEILGLPGNKAILRTDSCETSRWGSEAIGKCDVKRYSISKHFGKDNSVTRAEVHDFNRETVMPSEIMGLPRANRKRYFGYFLSPVLGAFHGPVFFNSLLTKKGSVDSHIPRPVSHQYLNNTDEKDNSPKESPDLYAIGRITADTSVEDSLDDLLASEFYPDDRTDDLVDESV